MSSPYAKSVELAADGFAALKTLDSETPGTVATVPIKPSAAPVGLEVPRGCLDSALWVREVAHER